MTQPEKPKPMNFSLSAFQDFQQCEEKYYLKHVRKLTTTTKAPALEKGILLHDYMNAYYEALAKNHIPDDAHVFGMAQLASHTERIDVSAAAAYYGGDQELAEEIRSMPEVLKDIAERYFRTRGRGDADRFQVLEVERWLNIQLVAGVQSNSRVDLLARDKATGLTFLWEHKTTGNIPSTAFRIRDLQTALYARVLTRYRDVTTGLPYKVDAIMWNYLRTKSPATPHQNKPTKANPIGALSKDRGIDTTWEKYAARIVELGLNLEDYADVYARLRDVETTIFFPRYELRVVVDVDALILDYAMVGARARQARWMWEQGRSKPIRTLTRNCDYCEFYKVCESALMGGDPEDVIKMRYVEGTQ